MSNTPTNDSGEGAAPKKSRKKLIIIVLAVLLIGGGVGGFFYMRRASANTDATKETAKDEKKVKSHKEESEDASEEHTEEEPEKPSKGNTVATKSINSAIPEDEDVKKVIELQPFIVNLADDEEARYLRLTVSIGLGEGEGGEEKPDEIFITRIRNAILAVLTTKKSEEVLTIQGKAALRKEILKAAQKASEEPHVLAIYITDFIVQM